jgi:hypothetical protein
MTQVNPAHVAARSGASAPKNNIARGFLLGET